MNVIIIDLLAQNIETSSSNAGQLICRDIEHDFHLSLVYLICVLKLNNITKPYSYQTFINFIALLIRNKCLFWLQSAHIQQSRQFFSIIFPHPDVKAPLSLSFALSLSPPLALSLSSLLYIFVTCIIFIEIIEVYCGNFLYPMNGNIGWILYIISVEVRLRWHYRCSYFIRWFIIMSLTIPIPMKTN